MYSFLVFFDKFRGVLQGVLEGLRVLLEQFFIAGFEILKKAMLMKTYGTGSFFVSSSSV